MEIANRKGASWHWITFAGLVTIRGLGGSDSTHHLFDPCPEFSLRPSRTLSWSFIVCSPIWGPLEESKPSFCHVLRRTPSWSSWVTVFQLIIFYPSLLSSWESGCGLSFLPRLFSFAADYEYRLPKHPKTSQCSKMSKQVQCEPAWNVEMTKCACCI